LRCIINSIFQFGPVAIEIFRHRKAQRIECRSRLFSRIVNRRWLFPVTRFVLGNDESCPTRGCVRAGQMLGWINQLLLVVAGQLVVLTHGDCARRACVHTESAENTKAVIDLCENGFLVRRNVPSTIPISMAPAIFLHDRTRRSSNRCTFPFQERAFP